ncbi:hypothetical protein SPI_02067 [Niveomyces insectorum RCEF 264]|uniref:Uncharacterized protein n=1 Tax=Niveomyces insectorum RCEF 264 TaxID=1081102 RepID=A0A162MQI6_9HYPO|nr:hypothetical protein SPI_02067 [Niveomyces insectorum RCEF 264]
MTSILDSFQQEIPRAVHYKRGDNPRTHAGGALTRESQPPFSGIELPVRLWLDDADEILENGDVRDELSRHFLPSWTERFFGSEGDVADAATLQFTHPVDLALTVAHGGKILSMAEYTAVIGEANNERVRSDRLWLTLPDEASIEDVRRQVNPPLRGCFAVSDFKKRNAIRVDEIDAATVDWVDVGNMALSDSLFKSNSLEFLKQAVSYAYSFGTKYISVFD